jgi:hypothetical protein
MAERWHIRHVALLLLLATGAGSMWGEIPQNPVVERGGYRVLEGDFHVHTRFSDGMLSPFDVVIYARRQGLDVIGLTEHNMVFPGLLARWFARQTGGLIVMPSEEITTRDHHLIAIGIEKTIPARIPISEAIDRIHAQGGAAIAAHPVERYWKSYAPVVEKLDGAEVMHPIALRDNRAGDWRWGQMRDFYVRENAAGKRLTAIGSSDYHFFHALGVCRTILFVKEANEAGVMEAILSARTVVYGPEGETFGDPEMIALLAADPLPKKNTAPGFDAVDGFDAFFRTSAWLGVLAFILFKRRRSSSPPHS